MVDSVMRTRRRIPLSTYRVQFNQHFTFKQATELVPYLADLGISHCYASPILKARPGSTHGYDIVDHNLINPEIGTPEEFTRFVDALHERGMGLILDIVPNHMGIMGSDNAWWLDVLENGEASSYSSYFDIDWLPLKDELRHKVLVPVLGDAYGVALENGGLKLTFDRERGEFNLFYYDHRFPIDPKEYPRILQKCADRLAEGGNTPDFLEFQSLVSSFSHLPGQLESLPDKVAERNRDKEIHKRRLAELAARSPQIAQAIEERLQIMNGKPNDPASFEELHELIKAQAFRLAHWRVAIDDINYRRFFDINDLAALRMEDPAVYDATHRLVLSLMAEDKVDGLRIDHPDGLYNPFQYFQRLQSSFAALTPCDDGSAVTKTCRFLAIEKILTGGERLPASWPVSGTSGYDFTNLINGLFVEPSASTKMEATYRAFLGEKIEFEEVVYAAKKLIIRYRLASEVNVLANQLSRIALSRRLTCDFTLNGLRDAITEVVASFPIYRTYVTADGASNEDRQVIETAVSLAKWRNAAADTSIFDFLHEVLNTRIAEGQNRSYQDAVIAFAMKFQQFSSPVMAKGLEDTSFYRYTRLLSLNEVGGDPRKFGTAVAELHRANQERLKNWPHTMLATTTHDTKRSEDARMRIDVLSEVPAHWRLRLRHWKRLNKNKKQTVSGKPVPSLNEEYLLYQTLLGVWPEDDSQTKEKWQPLIERVKQYMIKALREAKENTSWINPNADYEKAVSAFVTKALTPGRKNRFLEDFLPFQRYIARLGLWNSLSQTLLKLTVPGVPDFYQGSELWDFRLVDPDNRTAVDYDRRKMFLDDLKSSNEGPGLIRQLLDNLTDARIKLYLTWKTLNLRQRYPSLFEQGKYIPLEVVGEKAKHIFAFARKNADATIIVVAPRLLANILSEEAATPIARAVWGDTAVVLPQTISQGEYSSLFGGKAIELREGSVAVADVLSDFPVGLLVNEQRAAVPTLF
jgi:(1->4)-alpha-D-glucan 1-alpha-D-glucosylmutase